MQRIKCTVVLVSVLYLLPYGGKSAQAAMVPLISNGKAQSVIVAGRGEFNRWVANQLQQYFDKFSGAQIPIVSAADARRRARNTAWILVGNAQSNELVEEAATKGLVSFEGLKRDGFILKTIKLAGRHALVIGGNGEAATMYATYDLLERYGATFLLTGDILPEKKPTWDLRNFDVRSNPAFRRRGLFVSFIYPNRSIMSLKDEREFVDQMAKMKMNYLQIFWFPYEPWLKYSYHGEVKWMGDVARKETGYVLWARDFGSYRTTDMQVGKEHFKEAGVYPRLAPPEFQQIENNEDAFTTAQNYLHEMIRYAQSRKIKVWLDIDATSIVPNLARYTTRTLTQPFHPIFGTFICPDNPVSWQLNEERLRSLFASYPNVEGYFLYLPEAYPVCNQGPKDRTFYLTLRPQYPGETEARVAFTADIPQDNDTVVDSNSGSLYFIQKFLEARDRIAPKAKLGIGGLGRLYLAPYIQKMFPDSVPFSDMESRAIWTPTGVPMKLFGEMRGRETTLSNRIDDDSDMLGMQFNVNLYDKDNVLKGGVKYGLAGFDSQMNRARGTETNTKYMAEGEWNPNLTPEEFYRDYAKQIFGEQAAPEMVKAFNTLEKNEEYLGWTGRGNFPCCGPPRELSIAYEYSKQPDLFSGPRFRGWRPFISTAHDLIREYTGSVKLLQEALEELKNARPVAAPRSRAYLAYLTNRTQTYILHLQTLVTWEQAYVDLDGAFQARAGGASDRDFVNRLDASVKEFQQARAQARTMAEKFSEIVDHPSDLGVLYRINIFMVTGTELVTELIENIDNYYHGRNYVRPVDFRKVYVEWPVLAALPWQGSEYASLQ
ncbi:MAG TPA: alpha-glucuronidase family glycosyl hydrolase [Terriglobia bacterium]|nr:alpha-glucuronidase family glycosyl hydrolase [Terriglobia bacterium]